MLTVKILGSGCANCKKLEAVAREAAASAGLDAEFIKLTDMKAIMAYELLTTPGLVFNGKPVNGGRIPTQSTLRPWLGVRTACGAPFFQRKRHCTTECSLPAMGIAAVSQRNPRCASARNAARARVRQRLTTAPEAPH